MKHRLHNANRIAGPDFTGGADELVMDSPLYPVRRFAPLVAEFAASFSPAPVACRARGSAAAACLAAQLNRALHTTISALKCRHTLPISEPSGNGIRPPQTAGEE